MNNITRQLRIIVLPLFLWAAYAPSALAQSCETSVEVTLGGNKDKSKRIDSMSKITHVQLLSVVKPNKYSCPSNKYFFHDNIFTTKKGCKGKFKITGTQTNCTSQQVSEISQVPLFLTRQSEPNVMFLLDDSGSMQFEVMPDTLIVGSANYIYPRASQVYGGSDYTNIVPTVTDNNIYNKVTRSPQSNAVYYNPSVTYNPWTKHDTTPYADAPPSCAPHNPELTSKGCRNLTAKNEQSAYWVGCSSASSCYYESKPGDRDDLYFQKEFWPATYYWRDSGDAWSGSYTKVEIRSSTSTYSGHGREDREDCADAENGNCTYAEEIQNFANWYTYYRSRILAARGGIGAAFVQQGSGMRVGFGAINQGENPVDGVDTAVINSGVRVFQGTAKEDFFTKLYTRPLNAAGTPLRYALDKAGQYFSRTDNRSPWSADPENGSNEPEASCRRSYTVLMTDGYWSGNGNAASTSSARSDIDSSNGSEITGPNDQSYTYSASDPFKDGRANTLADVAMYYWKRDLRTNIENNVAPLSKNPAFWQHMSVFGVGLGVSGSIDKTTAFNAIGTGSAISWPDPQPDTQNCSGATCAARIDDLLHAGVNSRGGFFSAANPDEFSTELSSVLQTIAVETASSASSIATNSTRLDTGTLVFQARFDTRDWSGRLVAFNLNPDGSLKSKVWDTDSSGKIPAHGSRTIITPNGTPGDVVTSAINFTVGNWSSLSSHQQNALKNGGSTDEGKAVLNWVRGDSTNEGGSLRDRNRVLGDIVNSDPFFVGSTENFGYDQLPDAEGTSYKTYLSSGKAGRTEMLYVGGNDGMLHAFNANTGVEKFAFVPLSSYSGLAELADPDYDHQYFVDGSPSAGDAYLSNTWKTILVGATGAGGRSVFALDVTDPDNFSASKFLWEFSTDSSDTHKLGVAMSNPVIARVKAGGQWVAIFGNGYNSGGNVKLMVVNLATGALIKAIDTGVTGNGNGLASVVPVDSDRDRITDYVYAGDLKGNLWKFDLTGNSTNNWDVAIKNGNTPTPLFVAVDDNGNRQPITSRPEVGKHETSGLMIYFGTGKYFETGDATVGTSPQIQDFYGIRDQGSQVSRSDLVTQTIVYEGVGVLQNEVGNDSDNENTDQRIRVVSNNNAGSPVAHGWRLQLQSPGTTSGSGERVTSKPILRDGRIIFTSNIPDNDPCGFGGTGWLMEVNANTGGRLGYSVFDINDDTLFTSGDYVKVGDEWLPVSGIGQDEMIKTPGIVSAGTKEYKYTSGTSGTIGVTREKSTQGNLGRQSWRQLK